MTVNARPRVDEATVRLLYEQSGAVRWSLGVDAFRRALEASVEKHAPADAGRFVASLHVADLALATACAAGNETAWEQFMHDYGPVLVRAASAIDPSGGARDLAEALHADLYGVRGTGEERQSLFRYFHGRSSLATWLRAVLSQRYVDRLRAARRHDPLPDDESPHALPGREVVPDPDHARMVSVMRQAMAVAIRDLAPRDRLRLASYYAEQLTLAEIGRLLGEHEATVSRHLARTRRDIRHAVERHLYDAHGMDDFAVARAFQAIVDGAASVDLDRWFELADERKKSGPDRST